MKNKMDMNFIMKCIEREHDTLKTQVNERTKELESHNHLTKTLIRDEYLLFSSQLAMLNHIKEMILWEYENQYPNENAE